MKVRATASSASAWTRLVGAPLALLLCLAWAPAHAAVQVSAGGNQASASVDLGPVEADLSLSFIQAENLQPSTLGVSAALVDPLALPLSIVQRLLGLNAGAVTSAFPLLLAIQPASQLSFSDTVTIELHTHNLEYASGSRLRLFRSSNGGAFQDITVAVEPGSVRTRGRTGGFSEFMVLLDLRPTSQVVGQKFDRVSSRLADASGLSLTERASLQAALQDARNATAAGQPALAIAELDEFDALVRQLSGTALPNRWSPANPAGNIAGDLQAGVATLRFSLGYLRDFGD